MINLDGIVKFLNNNDNLWVELESKPELFQYNHYMRFMDIIDIDYEMFEKNSSYAIYNINDIDINSVILSLSKNNIDLVGKVYFVKLLPQQYPLRQYEEPYEYTSKINRFYISIFTKNNSQFCIKDKVLCPSPKDIISVDPDDLYSIYNNNETEDVYLVVDILKD
jgi:hypothetical protein